MTKRSELPDLELACLKILWDSGDLTVREVRERLTPQRSLAYTTVLTVLDRLAHKGVVSRRKVGKTYIYHPEFERAEARDRAVRRLLDIYFDGSKDALRAHLGGAAVRPAPAPTKPAAPRKAPAAVERLDESLL